MTTVEVAPAELAVAARGLVKRYPGAEQPALAGLELEIFAGETFGLLGPNGAGKTTAISILATLLRPSGGSVRLFGLDPGRQCREVRRLIGLVPQEIALYPRLTVAENLAYFGRLHGLGGAGLKTQVSDCLAMVGLEAQGGRLVEACSGGMKRRANLAAGLLHRPRLLFLDEPTVGIDAQSRHVIFENLARLKAEGMTLLYTTHYMEEARQLCDRIAIVDAGRVVALGAPAELLAAQPDCRDLEELFLRLTGRHLRD